MEICRSIILACNYLFQMVDLLQNSGDISTAITFSNGLKYIAHNKKI